MLLISQDGRDMFETDAGVHIWQSGRNIFIENGPGASAFCLGSYESEAAAKTEYDNLRRTWGLEKWEVRVG